MQDTAKEKINKISIVGLIALFSVNIAYMADMAIIPAADAIFSEFSDAPVSLLNFILTGPQLIGVVSAILAGVLMRRFSKKSILVVFFALFTVFACFGVLIKDPVYVALMRGLVGFSFGGLAPVAIALVTEVYSEDEKKCNGLIGAFNGFTAIIGAIISIAAGILCGIRWDYVYYIYYAAIPFVIMLIFFVPTIKPQRNEPGAQEIVEGKTAWGSIIALIGSLLIICIIFNVMAYQCAMYVAQNSLGDSSFAGILSSVVTITTAVACFLFASLYDRIGRLVSCAIYGFLAIGFAACCFPMGQVWAVICFTILGFGYGLAMTFYYVRASAISSPENAATLTGVIAATIGLGSFLSSFVNTALMNLFHFQNLTSVFPIYIVMLVAGGILSIVLTLREKRDIKE